jgi:hypothetical protein
MSYSQVRISNFASYGYSGLPFCEQELYIEKKSLVRGEDDTAQGSCTNSDSTNHRRHLCWRLADLDAIQDQPSSTGPGGAVIGVVSFMPK